MKFIGISFTLKGQDFQKDIVPALEEIAGKYKDDDVTLLHGFMPKEVVEQKGFSTDVVDKLNELFPNQKSFYVDGSGPDRNALKNELYNNIATVFVIGKIIDGVKEEVILYLKANIKIFFFNPAEKTEEEKIADASSNLNDTNMNQQTNDVATSENLAKTGPVNPTNPNALENQPAGNGNAESLLHNKTADEDSNDQGGKTAEQQSVQEESLASKPEATNSGAGAEVDNEGGDTANNNKSDGPGVDSGAVINGGDASITGPGNPEGGAAATTETGTGINDGGGNAGAGDTGGNLNP